MEIESARKRTTIFLVACLAAVSGAVSFDAAADCAAPVIYDLILDRNSVVICPTNFTNRACPDPGGMLRENAGSGDTARLHDDCVPNPGYYGDPAADPCYVDECVPPGTYNYGFANPYDCYPYSCGTYYYSTVDVIEPLDDCQRLLGTTAPEPCTGCKPWISGMDLICGYAYTQEPYPDPAERYEPAPVEPWAETAEPRAETSESETPERMAGCLASRDCDDADGGDETAGVGADEYACACSILASGQGIIFPVNLALMGIGILLLLARRRKSR